MILTEIHSKLLAGYFSLWNEMIHLEGGAVFDLAVRTEGEEDHMHSCYEKIYFQAVKYGSL